ncbi:SWIM zinc finger family protein [Streptomyces nitrosporeus]|uniref:SWIM zinc finger family protein n=1 Tax=Streptomyces nitrosporeus TaxID=28894 RepID=UPI00399F09B1
MLFNGGDQGRAAAPAVRLTAEQVMALAPDDASRAAARRLASARLWSEVGAADPGVLWGRCEDTVGGSWHTVADSVGPAYLCDCPSRTSPCGHALGLLLLGGSGDAVARDRPPPFWAAEWLEARRRGPGGGAGSPKAGGRTVADPEAAARRAERRAERVTGGVMELEQRLADLLRGGLAAADRPGYALWEETAARMVDAQAPGLASRVRGLEGVTASGPDWPVRLLEECALLHLLDSAWLRREQLPAPLAATVRTRVGLTAPAGGTPVRDDWLVLARYDTPDGKLTARRTWLYGRRSGRTTLLLSFGAAGRPPAYAFSVGASVDAVLAPHSGGGRLRSDLVERYDPPSRAVPPPPGGSVTEATEAYGRALRDDPWLDSWPAVLREVIPVPSKDGWQLVGASDGLALPVVPAALSRPGLWKLVAVAGGGPVSVFGECGHPGFDPLAIWPTGTTTETHTVPGPDTGSGPGSVPGAVPGAGTGTGGSGIVSLV